MGAPPQALPRERLCRKHGDCLASCQEANHAAGVQRAHLCPGLPDRAREEQTEAAEVEAASQGVGAGWAVSTEGVMLGVGVGGLAELKLGGSRRQRRLAA